MTELFARSDPARARGPRRGLAAAGVLAACLSCLLLGFRLGSLRAESAVPLPDVPAAERAHAPAAAAPTAAPAPAVRVIARSTAAIPSFARFDMSEPPATSLSWQAAIQSASPPRAP